MKLALSLQKVLFQSFSKIW